MTLLWHLLRFDLRRIRWLLTASVLLPAAITTLDAIRPAVVMDARVLQAVELAVSIAWLADLLLFFVIVALVVQTHSLVGSDAFWMTRPIPWRALLASKLVLLALTFVALRVACELALMAFYRLPARDAVLVAFQMTLTHGLWLVVVMLAASFARHIAGFALLCGGVLLSVVFVFVGLAMAMLAANGMAVAGGGGLHVGLSMPSSGPGGSDGTPTVVLLAAGIAGGLALLVVQYRFRSRRLAIPATLAAVAVIGAVVSFWPWPVLQARTTVPAWASAADAVRVSADPLSVRFDADEPVSVIQTQRTWRYVRADVRVDGLAAGWTATLQPIATTFTARDRSPIVGQPFGFGERPRLGSSDLSHENVVLPSVLGVGRVIGLHNWPMYPVAVMMMREADFRSNRGVDGHYRGTLDVSLSRFDVAASLPLRAGATYQQGAQRLIVRDVQFDPARRWLALHVRRSGARSVFHRHPPLQTSYYLRNRRLGVAVVAHAQQLTGVFKLLPVGHAFDSSDSVTAGFGFDESLLVMTNNEHVLPELKSVDDAWIADADLAIVTLTAQGTVRRTLEMSGVRIVSGQGR